MIHINLDTPSYRYQPWVPEHLHNELLIDKTKNKNVNDNDIVFSIISENFSWNLIDNELVPKLYNIFDLSGKNIYWILNDTAINYKFKNIKNVIFIKYYALYTYYLLFLAGHPYNTKWNSESKKGLFLAGKLIKPHRIGLLYFLYKKNLLDNCIFSSYLTDNMYEDAKNIIYQLDNETNINLEEFFSKCYNKLDVLINNFGRIEPAINEKYCHSGFPYDESLYQNTSISFITESFLDKQIHMSEKTFRPIANKHPFIMIAPINSNKELNDIGFKTFEKYLKYQDYDSYNGNYKVEIAAENFKYFIENYSKYKNDINLDVEHNFNIFTTFCKNEIDKLKNFINISDDKVPRLFYEMNIQNY